MKRNIIRVGDRVRVINPSLRVKRVGYPLHFREIPLPDYATEIIKLLPRDGSIWTVNEIATVEDALKKYEVRRQNFGGPIRSIHYHPQDLSMDEYEFGFPASRVCPKIGHIGTVTDVVTRKTGHRSAGIVDWETGMQDPPHLANEKTHRIATVEFDSDILQSVFASYCIENLLKVEAND